MSEVYVGLDVGSRHCELLGMRLDGSVTTKRHFRTSEAELIIAFKDLPGELHVHMEAGELAPWIREVIKPFVKSVIISHPRDNAWIAKDPNKGDKIDAFKLADLRRMNRVHPVHYAEQRSRRDFKQLVQHYDDLTGQEVRLKLKIKARLRTQGVIIHNSSPFSEKGFPKVLAQVPSAEMRSAITQLYQGLVYTYELWDDARELMLTASKSFPEVKRFQAVPGIGPIGAARFSAYVQTPHRFSSKRKLWRYCRLGVCQRSSDGKKLSHPQLDKAGCGRLKDVARKAFEAAIHAKKDNQFKRAYERALQSTHDKTHARLTVMRKIISVLRAMWLTNTAYQDQLGQ